MQMKLKKFGGSGLRKLTNRKKKGNPPDPSEPQVVAESRNWIASFSKLVKSCGTNRSQNSSNLSVDNSCEPSSLASSLASIDKFIERRCDQEVQNLSCEDQGHDANLSIEPIHEVPDTIPASHEEHLTKSGQCFSTTPPSMAKDVISTNDEKKANTSNNGKTAEVANTVIATNKGKIPVNSSFSRPPLGSMNRNQSSGYHNYGQPRMKPHVVQRCVTDNSNISLHRRQQPLDPFEFDTASLRRIASTATDALNDQNESDIISLPKTIDFSMRAVSAMTTLSDEGDIDDIDGDNNFGSIDDKEESTRWSVSPTSVVDTYHANGTADWMLEWATAPQEKENELKLTQTLSGELTSTSFTWDCSASSATLESTLTDPSDLQIEPVYISATPVPLKAASVLDGLIHFAGWLAVDTESSWIENDTAIVSEEAVQFVQIISPVTGSELESSLVVRLSSNNDVRNIRLCPSTCRIDIRLVSKRFGCCLVLADGNVSVCLLPVNVVPSRLLSNRNQVKRDTTYELLFMPFKKAFNPDEQYYAPDSQHDAVIHLSFTIDLALRSSCVR